MPRKSWLNNRLHNAESSLQWRRRLFSINLKLIHSTQAYYPVLSVKKARRSTPAETSKKPWTRDHSRTQRCTEGGKSTLKNPALDHRACTNYLNLLLRKDSSKKNGTKPQPHQAGALFGSSQQMYLLVFCSWGLQIYHAFLTFIKITNIYKSLPKSSPTI